MQARSKSSVIVAVAIARFSEFSKFFFSSWGRFATQVNATRSFNSKATVGIVRSFVKKESIPVGFRTLWREGLSGLINGTHQKTRFGEDGGEDEDMLIEVEFRFMKILFIYGKWLTNDPDIETNMTCMQATKGNHEIFTVK